jgi:KDO2-lipid IV(A) lauroyltransferase
VDIEGAAYLDVCRRQGHGGLLVTGHFGNWELLGAAIAALGYPISYLIKDQSNPWVNRLQNEIRRRAGIGVIRQGASARHLLYALKRHEFVGILGDQDAGDHGIFVNFLGRRASAFRGVAYFAYRTRCPIIPTFIIRQAGGRHRAVVTAPIEVDPGWDEETAVHVLTQAHTDRLADLVRAHPDQYFWVHRRWKTRPPAERPARRTPSSDTSA